MKMMGFQVLPEWNRKVTSPKWSRVILRSFRAILLMIFTIKMAPQTPQTPNPQFSQDFPGISIGNQLFWRAPCASTRSLCCLEDAQHVLSRESSVRDQGIPFLDNPGKIWEKCGFRVWGVCGAIFSLDMIERLAQNLRRIILLPFGLVTFRIHFRKPPKPFIFIVFVLSGRDHDSQNQYYLSVETPRHSK